MLNLNHITMLLVIIGGLNLGLVGALDINLVSIIVGDGVLLNLAHILIGLAAIHQLLPMLKNLGHGDAV